MRTLLDYTTQGRRPTTSQILSDWIKAGRPREFSVEYGETYALFEFVPHWGRFDASGNGCRGIKREEVLAKLNKSLTAERT